MGTLTTSDGTEIFYKDGGNGQPIVFSHGWPLSADDWDIQMMFFLQHGYRVIAHDRRGHGRSTQTATGHDMDHYADDLAALTADLDLHDAVHIGHSTGGGEVTRYLARHGESRVAKAVLISSVPPLMVQTPANPGGLPKKVFDGFQDRLRRMWPVLPRPPGGPVLQLQPLRREANTRDNRQLVAPGHDGRRRATTASSPSRRQISPKTLRRSPCRCSSCTAMTTRSFPMRLWPPTAELLKNGTLKTYSGWPHGMFTTHAETINADLLTFLRER